MRRKVGLRKPRKLSRGEFLAAGAGAGLSVLALGPRGLALDGAGAQVPGLEIFEQGYPRAFFFRQVEDDARAGRLSFEQWEKKYLPLNGIMGKALNEARDYNDHNNLSFFLRYKANNPTKAVFIHYHGTGRRVRDGATDFFAGHWLYYRGTKLTKPVGEERSASVLSVADTSAFRLERIRDIGDDIVIARVGDGGRTDWSNAEHVRLKAINKEAKTITVERGAYGTRPLSFPAGSYLAAHVATPQNDAVALGQDALLWSYNFSSVCPRDAGGRDCGEALADYLAGKFGPGGELSSLDGIVFDVLSSVVRFASPISQVDVDADGRADGGVIGGTNVVGPGTVSFLGALRDRLPDKIIMADGHIPTASQRGFRVLNGIESEGFPGRTDLDLDRISSGENIFRFWKENSTFPSLNYVNFKYRDAGRYRNTFREPNLSEDKTYRKARLALASAQFTDAAFTYYSPIWSPPEKLWREGGVMVHVLDELWQGLDQRPNWLGMPLGPAVLPAAGARDLLEGRGETWPQEFVGRFGGRGVEFEQDPASGMIIRSAGSDPDRTLAFALPGLRVPSRDLFVSLRLRSDDALRGYSPAVGRRVNVAAAPAGRQGASEFTWANDEAFTAEFHFRDVGPGEVNLRFWVEGEGQLFFEKLTARPGSGAGYREFENGVVFSNPSNHPYTFDLGRLLPGVALRRLPGSSSQDPRTNNGQSLGEKLTLGARDALFVMRESA